VTERPPPETSEIANHCTSAALLLALAGSRAMRRLRAVHEGYGLKPRQFQLLALLEERGEVEQRELGAVMELDPSMVVAVLNPLEQRGLVIRTRSVTDRRRHTVALTDDGSAHLTAALDGQAAAEHELFAALSPLERDQLRGLLLRLEPGRTGEACEPACDGSIDAAG
jgi:DNA-binding MarR family transcriptional regulator